MLNKRKRGGIWLTFVLFTNIGLVAYLQTYSEAAGRFVFGLPEAFVVLVVFVFAVTGANAVFAWYYLGKPKISDVFNPDTKTKADSEMLGSSETKQSEEG